MTHDRHPIDGTVIAFLGYALYALSDACVKALGGALGPFETSFAGGVVGLLALPFIKRSSDPWMDAFRAARPWIWWARAAAGAVTGFASVVAFSRLPMPEAFALVFLMPVFITILSAAGLREHVGRRRWIAVALGFAGVLVVLRPGFRALDIGHVTGILCAAGGAALVTLSRVAVGRESRLSLIAPGGIGLTAANGALAILHPIAPHGVQIPLIVAYGMFAVLGGTLLNAATQRTPASRIAPVQYSQMVWAVLLGSLIFHQAVDRITFIGIAVIVASGLLTIERRRLA